MTTLHLGVLDVPYADKKSFRKVGRRAPRSSRKSSVNTGDVAEILEAKYGIMQFFWARYEEEISNWLVDSLEKAIESMELGAPLDLDAFGEATSKIENKFRQFLTNKEMDGRIIGVPTQASLQGFSHRFKRPGKRREVRPSFIDTGLYEGSFRVWID